MKCNVQSDREHLRKWCALIVVLVLAVFGIVQVSHVHHGSTMGDESGSPANHCLLCVAGHSAPAITAINFAPVLVLTVTVATVANPQLLSELAIPTESIRPPPQGL